MKREKRMHKNKLLRRVAGALLMTTLLLGCSACSKQETTGDTVVRVGSLKGPTSIGLLDLMERNENNETENVYTFTMETAADTLLAQMVQKELDIALVPANVAAVLYNKTDKEVAVIDINTLGVLYMLTGDDTIETIQDLKGKTICLTGKGTTPDYVLQYVLEENGILEGEVQLEYKSEATEVAAVLKNDSNAIGLLPQPFVTVAMAQNENLKIAFDMNEEWQNIQGEEGSSMVTGVTVVRKEFLLENEEMVWNFLKDHKASSQMAVNDVEKTASFVVKRGIMEKEEIAGKAIPECNITFIEGNEMKQALSGYLEVLYEKDAKSVGGELPGDDFYYQAH